MQPAKLNQYRERLLQLRERLRDDITRITERLPETVAAPGDVSSVGTHNADHDVEGLDAELAIEQNQESIYHEVEAALRRVDDGSFGKCENCGREIVKERLDALPYTAYCTQCAHRLQTSGAA